MQTVMHSRLTWWHSPGAALRQVVAVAGVVAAADGVAQAEGNVIHISGHGISTGRSRLSAVRQAGGP